jgi:hypothetical protein
MSENSIAPSNGIRTDADGEITALEAEVARKRAAVAVSLGELRRRVDHATSWRYWAREYPWIWIAAGFSLGFIAGLSGSNRRH